MLYTGEPITRCPSCGRIWDYVEAICHETMVRTYAVYIDVDTTQGNNSFLDYDLSDEEFSNTSSTEFKCPNCSYSLLSIDEDIIKDVLRRNILFFKFVSEYFGEEIRDDSELPEECYDWTVPEKELGRTTNSLSPSGILNTRL